MEKIIVALFVLMMIVTIGECDVSSTALVATTINCGPELICSWSRLDKCLLYFTKCVANQVFQVGKLLSVSNCLYNVGGDFIINFIRERGDPKKFDYPRIVDGVLDCMGLPAYVDITNDIYNVLKEFHRIAMGKK